MREWGIGCLKGVKEMHSAQLSVTASVNREHYFYMPSQKQSFSQLAALPPCSSHLESVFVPVWLSIHETRMKFELVLHSVTMLILHWKRGN